MYGTQPDPQLHPPVLDKLMFASRLHEHADPAQRVQGIAALPPDSPVVAQLLAADPSADVRAAAAARCRDTAALAGALQTEAEPAVRAALVAALAEALAADDARRATVLDDIADEDVLVDIALAAERASVRAAAAERVHTPGPLRRLHKGARDKDRGVARLARERLDAIETRTEGAAAAEAILREAEALLDDPGPIVTAAVELDKRWKALALGDDAERRTRWEDIGRRMQQRFDRELEAQRTRAQFERRLGVWLGELQPPESSAALPALRETLDAMRTEAAASDNARAVARLAEAEQKIAQWESIAPVFAAAEALVKEAEELADATTADDAQLPTRWHALDIAGRTPALTRRFEAALLVIEKRRLAAVRAAEQEQGNARHALHTVLHEAEQALAAGQLQEARAAADRTRALKLNAGTLPKPTIQRLSRVVQQLVELERWQQFGQQTARMQLVERAEALPQQALAPTALAREVQQLRAEWKKLDEQVEGKQVVPKPVWERFDAACERAYAPAARHFAEQAALHKQARKQREEFIDAAAAHAPTLATEPRDWRAIERWLRDTESAWRDKALGSLEPGIWKKFDAKLKAALAPLHGELSAARAQAKKERETLIAEAESLAAKAGERDTPSRVKELQARWQANAKTSRCAARRARAVGSVPRRMQRGVRGAHRVAQGRGRAQVRPAPCVRGTRRAGRANRQIVRRRRSGDQAPSTRAAGAVEAGRHRTRCAAGRA
jgi:DNA repair protein SbcC/Rad50